jgi:YggT family protein
MSNQTQMDETAVDRRAETTFTQEPGYAATEQVTRDVAAEGRLRFLQIDRILYTLLGILEIVLGLRFVLKLIAANADSGFSVFIYGVTGVFLAPFNALVGTPKVGGSVLEVNTLIAMAVYALLFWVLVRILQIGTSRTTARTITRSTREQTPGGPGNEKITHTTIH